MSSTKRAAMIALLIAYPVCVITTRTLGAASLVARVLPFGFPVAVVMFAWLVIHETTLQSADSSDSSGIPFAVAHPLGHPKRLTSRMASLMVVAWVATRVWMFPESAGFSGAYIAVFSVWWLLSAAFVGFAIPRLRVKH